MSLAAPKDIVVQGSTFRVGVVASRFNQKLVDGLLKRVLERLLAAGVPEKAITVVRVPGSHEIPWAAQALALESRDVVIGLGVLIGGAVAWIGQARWRRAARRLDADVRALHQELDVVRRRFTPEAPRTTDPAPYTVIPPPLP